MTLIIKVCPRWSQRCFPTLMILWFYTQRISHTRKLPRLVQISQGKEQICSSVYICSTVPPLFVYQHLHVAHRHPKNIFCPLLKQTGNVCGDLSVTRGAGRVISAYGAEMSSNTPTVGWILFRRAGGLWCSSLRASTCPTKSSASLPSELIGLSGSFLGDISDLPVQTHKKAMTKGQGLPFQFTPRKGLWNQTLHARQELSQANSVAALRAQHKKKAALFPPSHPAPFGNNIGLKIRSETEEAVPYLQQWPLVGAKIKREEIVKPSAQQYNGTCCSNLELLSSIKSAEAEQFVHFDQRIN